MNCGDIGPLLSAYYDGEATAEERKLVEDCLASSPEAREQLQDYRRITGEFQSIGQPTPPSDLRRSVMNRVHQMSGATAARNARAATNRYSSAERTATGSMRRPLRLGDVIGQGFRFGALAAALVAVLIVFTVVFAQLHRSQNAGVGSAEETQTAVAQVVTTATPTTLPTDTPSAALMTSTPQSITPPPTSTPGGPTDTPPQTLVASSLPTRAPAPPTSSTGGPVTPIAATTLTNTQPVAPLSSATPVPASPTGEPPTATAAPPTATAPAPTSTSEPATHTPVPPTSTPLPTNTPTPSPTPACAFSAVRGFGKVYSEHPEVGSALGCAINSEIGMSGTVLSFQYGTMIWDSNHRLIYIFYNQGQTVEMYNESWDPSDGEPSPVVTAPTGLYIPVRGFGKVWYQHQLWNRLGFATEQYELPVTEALQAFEHGRMLWTSQKLIYAMVGKVVTSDDALASQFSGTWELYQDTFVDKGQVVPTPVGSINPDGSLNVTLGRPEPLKRSNSGQ